MQTLSLEHLRTQFTRLFLMSFLTLSMLPVAKGAGEGTPYSANSPTIVCGQASGSATNSAGILPGCTGTDTLEQGGFVLGRLLPYLISWSIGVMGLIAFYFFVEAGIQLILSQGNEEKLKAAQKTIIAAAIGLVIATTSFILVSIASRFNLF